MIFPEGSIARRELQRFRPGVRRILDADPVPVIPSVERPVGFVLPRKDDAARQT
jgi:1-acyl-sn-glycerol-3-phosphate acyltransferase